MNSTAGGGVDLSGKLIIKVTLGEDIRRIPIHNEDITYDELVLMMQRVFRGKLSTHDDILVKYKDEDGDLITIFDSSDLTFAIQCSRILKITLSVNGKPPSLVGDVGGALRRELQRIRDSINTLLDRTDPQPSATLAASVEPALTTGTSASHSASRPGEGKEFDPLSSRQPISHGIMQSKVTPTALSSSEVSTTTATAAMTDRAGAETPDSLSSIGSSASHQQRQQQQLQQQQLQQQQQQQQLQLQQQQQQQQRKQQQQQQQQQQQSGSGDGRVSYAAMVSHHGYTGQVTSSFAPTSAPAGQGEQPSAQYQPPHPSSSAPPSGQTPQYAQSPMTAPQAQPTPRGQFAQGVTPVGSSGQPALPPSSSSSQAYQGYPPQSGQAGYSQYSPGLPQPSQPPQPQPGMYRQGSAPEPAPGQPQPQSSAHPPQAPVSGYPSGSWNLQAPGQQQQKLGGGFPVPPATGPQPGGAESPSGPNPYSRGPAYSAPYPRPAGNYPQGYQ